jgi:hypothetical protein
MVFCTSARKEQKSGSARLKTRDSVLRDQIATCHAYWLHFSFLLILHGCTADVGMFA